MYSNSIRFLWYMWFYQIAEIVISLFLDNGEIYLSLLFLPGAFFLMKAGREEALFKRIIPVWMIYIICELLSLTVGHFTLIVATDYASELARMLLVCIATARVLEKCGEKAYAAYAEWLCVIFVLLYVGLFLQTISQRISGMGLFCGGLYLFVNIMLILEYFLLLSFYRKSRRLLKRANGNLVLRGEGYDRSGPDN